MIIISDFTEVYRWRYNITGTINIKILLKRTLDTIIVFNPKNIYNNLINYISDSTVFIWAGKWLQDGLTYNEHCKKAQMMTIAHKFIILYFSATAVFTPVT